MGGRREVQIEKQKIDDMTMQEAIGQVAKNAGEKQPEGEPTPWVARFIAREQHGDDDERDAGERDEKSCCCCERNQRPRRYS